MAKQPGDLAGRSGGVGKGDVPTNGYSPNGKMSRSSLQTAPQPAKSGAAAQGALTWRVVAAGAGWRVTDVRCGAGPGDEPYEECHAAPCIAAVTHGTFQYRSAMGTAVFVPGALLLGNRGTCFECRHEHGIGDRCLAFHFAPDHLEAIMAAVPGARRLDFSVPCLPPTPALTGLLAAAEAARDEADGAALEELALDITGAVAATLAQGAPSTATPKRRDVARVTQALRRIEEAAEEALSLADLAGEAAMSPYHFLRTFRRVAGMTPHQYLLRTRLHRAALRLRRTTEPVSVIAFDVGFNDLSTFNRRFQRVIGVSPSAFRTAGVRQ
jgi:AraC family transcriptional regulator